MNRSIPFALCALIGIGCTAITGCNSKPAASTTTSPAPDKDKAMRFLTALKGMAPDKRQAYAAQHQDEVQNLNGTNDPALKTDFMRAMQPNMFK